MSADVDARPTQQVIVHPGDLLEVVICEPDDDVIDDPAVLQRLKEDGVEVGTFLGTVRWRVHRDGLKPEDFRRVLELDSRFRADGQRHGAVARRLGRGRRVHVRQVAGARARRHRLSQEHRALRHGRARRRDRRHVGYDADYAIHEHNRGGEHAFLALAYIDAEDRFREALGDGWDKVWED